MVQAVRGAEPRGQRWGASRAVPLGDSHVFSILHPPSPFSQEPLWCRRNLIGNSRLIIIRFLLPLLSGSQRLNFPDLISKAASLVCHRYAASKVEGALSADKIQLYTSDMTVIDEIEPEGLSVLTDLQALIPQVGRTAYLVRAIRLAYAGGLEQTTDGP